MNQIEEPLKTILKSYCHVECYDPVILRNAMISGKGFPYDANLFKFQLREAIDRKSISPEDYEALTEEDFDSQEDLQA